MTTEQMAREALRAAAHPGADTESSISLALLGIGHALLWIGERIEAKGE